MPSRRRLLAVALALVIALAAEACSDGAAPSGWERIDDIQYLVAGDLPEGWVVNHATLRPGRPRSEWHYRAEVLADEGRTRFLVITADRVLRDGAVVEWGVRAPGAVEPVDVDEMTYLFVYAGITPEDDTTARGVSAGGGEVGLRVVEVTSGPHDDELVRRIAQQHAEARDLDFDVPSSALDAGFEPVATLTELEDVADYSVVWSSAEDAGRTRDEGREREGPSLFINVGARMYAPVSAVANGLPEDVDDAVVERDEDDGGLSLGFLHGGSPVTVSGEGVDEATVRALARSLRAVPYAAWRDDLGDRLVVDEPEDRERPERVSPRG